MSFHLSFSTFSLSSFLCMHPPPKKTQQLGTDVSYCRLSFPIENDYVEIHNKFSKERAMLPLMFLSMPGDKFNYMWTKKIPTAPILNRLVLVAQKSLQVLEGQLTQYTRDIDFKVG